MTKQKTQRIRIKRFSLRAVYTHASVKGHLNKLNLEEFSWFSLLVNFYSRAVPAEQGLLGAQ